MADVASASLPRCQPAAVPCHPEHREGPRPLTKRSWTKIETVPRLSSSNTVGTNSTHSHESNRWRSRPAFAHGEHVLSLIHISEPTRLLSISYAVFCLKKKKKK